MALGRLWQLAVGWRLNLETSVAGLMAGARIIMSDPRFGVDIAAAIDRRLHLLPLAETPLAFDHGIGRIDAVNDDGHAGVAGHNNVETACPAGKCRGRSSDQKCQCDPATHRVVPNCCMQPTRMRRPKG